MYINLSSAPEVAEGKARPHRVAFLHGDDKDGVEFLHNRPDDGDKSIFYTKEMEKSAKWRASQRRRDFDATVPWLLATFAILRYHHSSIYIYKGLTRYLTERQKLRGSTCLISDIFSFCFFG